MCMWQYLLVITVPYEYKVFLWHRVRVGRKLSRHLTKGQRQTAEKVKVGLKCRPPDSDRCSSLVSCVCCALCCIVARKEHCAEGDWNLAGKRLLLRFCSLLITSESLNQIRTFKKVGIDNRLGLMCLHMFCQEPLKLCGVQKITLTYPVLVSSRV